MVPTPITRKEQFLAKIAGADIEIAPITREEQFLAKIAGDDVSATPITREEQFLNAIAENGGGGISGVTWLPVNINVSGGLPSTRNNVRFETVFVGTSEGSLRMAGEVSLPLPIGEKLYFPVASLGDSVFLQFSTIGSATVAEGTDTAHQIASGLTGNTVWRLYRRYTTATELNINVTIPTSGGDQESV